jgi:hypothetical protein
MGIIEIGLICARDAQEVATGAGLGALSGVVNRDRGFACAIKQRIGRWTAGFQVLLMCMSNRGFCT